MRLPRVIEGLSLVWCGNRFIPLQIMQYFDSFGKHDEKTAKFDSNSEPFLFLIFIQESDSGVGSYTWNFKTQTCLRIKLRRKIATSDLLSVESGPRLFVETPKQQRRLWSFCKSVRSPVVLPASALSTWRPVIDRRASNVCRHH